MWAHQYWQIFIVFLLFSKRWYQFNSRKLRTHFACTRGVARIFQSGGGGHTVSKQGLFNCGQDIVMAFSPPVVSCLVKKACKRGGHGYSRTLLAMPLAGTMTRNSWVMVAEGRTYVFRWSHYCGWHRVCLSSLCLLFCGYRQGDHFFLVLYVGEGLELCPNHGIRCHKNLKFGNFRLWFGRLRQRIVSKCVPHVQRNYFSSFNQSDHCFLALPSC